MHAHNRVLAEADELVETGGYRQLGGGGRLQQLLTLWAEELGQMPVHEAAAMQLRRRIAKCGRPHSLHSLLCSHWAPSATRTPSTLHGRRCTSFVLGIVFTPRPPPPRQVGPERGAAESEDQARGEQAGGVGGVH